MSLGLSRCLRMNPTQLMRFILGWASMLALISLSGCDKEAATFSNLSGNPNTVTPIGQVSSLGFYVKPILADGVQYYFHEQSSLNSSCIVSTGDTTNNDLYCILDVPELDLYFNPITLNYNAPASMCPYAVIAQYGLYQFQPGEYVGVASVTVDSTGKSTVTSGSLDKAGVPTCPYDYTGTPGAPGPNCCTGTWTVHTTTTNGGVTTTSDSTGYYTGVHSNCLVGPSVDLSPGKDSGGYPLDIIMKAPANGLNVAYTLTAPITKGYNSNLYLANYFDPSLYGSSTNFFPPDSVLSGGFPSAESDPTMTRPFKPYYQFICLDEAQEINARIRILIRSWDTVANFTANSNPYSTGTQASFPDHGLHNYGVWQDYLTTYPQGGL